MLIFFEVRPKTEFSQVDTDRYIELKTITLGYFEAQIFRHREDGTHYDPASLFAVADETEAATLLAALQTEWPDVEFEVVPRQSESGTKFNPVTI
jgi:hypothetical protein